MDFYPNEQLQAVEATVDVAEFAYVPLKAERQEFRILTVHASSKCSTDTIHATLDIQSLLEKPQYETVSYCWGDASVRSTTVLNGHLFDVPASSEKTLRRLRHKDTDRVLWIDAICINQRNIDERSQQVAMMDLIYKSGIRNLIWLGETEPRHADDALEAFNVLWQGIISCTGDGNIMPFIWDAEERHGKSVRTLIVPAEFDFEPIRRVFRSQWFTRLWVIQEAALSATNICLFGHRELDLLQVLKTSKWLLASIPVLPFDLNPESGLMSAGEMWLFVDPFLRPPHRAYRGHLTKAMHSARGFKATEPKDYLYAVLGLVHVFMGHDLARDPLLLPDYRRALKDVYTDAAKYSIKESGEHEFFHGAFRRQVDREDPTWPSWLPRWDRAHNVAHDAYPLSRHHSAGISTQVAARLVSHETDAGLTMFPGFMLDTVKHANEPLPFPGGSLDEGIEYTYDNIVESYIDAKTTFMQHALSNSDRESQWPKVLGQTLTAGINHLSQTLTPDSAAEMLLLFDKYMQQGTLPPEDDDDDDVPFDEQADLASDMHFSMRMMWTHRRFFATDDGFFGLGPGFMAPSDRVAVLYGCRCPVVLRPLQHEDAYEFIGVAYVHGIMEGQAIDGDLKSKRGPDMDICMR